MNCPGWCRRQSEMFYVQIPHVIWNHDGQENHACIGQDSFLHPDSAKPSIIYAKATMTDNKTPENFVSVSIAQIDMIYNVYHLSRLLTARTAIASPAPASTPKNASTYRL